jgi:hypothetical protein
VHIAHAPQIIAFAKVNETKGKACGQTISLVAEFLPASSYERGHALGNRKQ